jgi:hypothetical protein
VNRRVAGWTAAALAVMIMTAACRSGADPAPATGNTVRTEPPRTTTTDPYAVPAVIDAAYVNRILAGLDAAMGDVARMVIDTRTIPREALDRMRALYGNDRILQLVIDTFQDDIRRSFSNYKANPGNTTSEVTQLLSATPACIFVRVLRDYSAVASSPPHTSVQWIALRPVEPSRDPRGFNSTTWAFVYEGYQKDRTAPTVDPCQG